MLDKLAEAVTSVLPGDLGDDIKKNIDSALQAQFEKMELVTQEQLDIQQKILLRSRERIEMLEQEVSRLEKLIEEKSSTG